MYVLRLKRTNRYEHFKQLTSFYFWWNFFFCVLLGWWEHWFERNEKPNCSASGPSKRVAVHVVGLQNMVEKLTRLENLTKIQSLYTMKLHLCSIFTRISQNSYYHFSRQFTFVVRVYYGVKWKAISEFSYMNNKTKWGIIAIG